MDCCMESISGVDDSDGKIGDNSIDVCGSLVEEAQKIQTVDTTISYRFILYRKETFFQTENVVERGYWSPSISLSKQAADISKVTIERKRGCQPPVHRGYENFTGLLELFNRYEYYYVIESSFTGRSGSQRGINAQEISDTRMDVENIIYNETVRYVLWYLITREDYQTKLNNLEKSPKLMNEGFTTIFKLLNKDEMFNQIRSVLISQDVLNKDLRAQSFIQNNKESFVSWLFFKSTYFTITNHIRRVLAVYKRQNSFYLQ